MCQRKPYYLKSVAMCSELNTSFGRFIVTGVSTAVIHFAVLVIAIESLHTSAALGSSAGYMISLYLNYHLHKNWTYKNNSPHKTSLPRFLVVVSGGFFLNTGAMKFFLTATGLHYLLAQALAIFVVLWWNFALMRVWVFKTTDTARDN